LLIEHSHLIMNEGKLMVNPKKGKSVPTGEKRGGLVKKAIDHGFAKTLFLNLSQKNGNALRGNT